jgi:hypothetical protein
MYFSSCRFNLKYKMALTMSDQMLPDYANPGKYRREVHCDFIDSLIPLAAVRNARPIATSMDTLKSERCNTGQVNSKGMRKKGPRLFGTGRKIKKKGRVNMHWALQKRRHQAVGNSGEPVFGFNDILKRSGNYFVKRKRNPRSGASTHDGHSVNVHGESMDDINRNTYGTFSWKRSAPKGKLPYFPRGQGVRKRGRGLGSALGYMRAKGVVG